MNRKSLFIAGLSAALLAACSSDTPTEASPTPPVAAAPKNVIFFLGDGMGLTTLTAARIYSVGEDGELTIDTLPETAFVKTYSNDAQTTDSAPSMAAYMTGVKMNNEVISMSWGTRNECAICGRIKGRKRRRGGPRNMLRNGVAIA